MHKFFVICLLIYSVVTNLNAEDIIFMGDELYENVQTVSPCGDVDALVIFAAEKKDTLISDLPAWSGDIFNDELMNSLSHYYKIQSNNNHTLTGDILNRWYYSHYLFTDTTEYELIV